MEVTNRDLREIFKLPPRQHHLKAVVLVVVICACVVFLGYYLIYHKDISDAKPVTTRSAVEYNISQAIKDSLAKLKDVTPATQTEIQASLIQLSKLKTTRVSQGEIDQALNQLKAK